MVNAHKALAEAVAGKQQPNQQQQQPSGFLCLACTKPVQGRGEEPSSVCLYTYTVENDVGGGSPPPSQQFKTR